MLSIFKTFIERTLPLCAFIFPFLEINSSFASKVFQNIDNVSVKVFYFRQLAPLIGLYQTNIYAFFILMVAIFIICSKGSFKLTKFVRFNIIQAILLAIVAQAINQLYYLAPLFVRETILGTFISNGCYGGISLAILYCSAIILFFGRYPRLPIVTEAAKLQVQRGNNDD
jgi:hypothetical protein